MKFYGKNRSATFRENVEVLAVVLRFLQSKEKVFNVTETALREAGHNIYMIFSEFGPKEIEAAIAEARSVKSSVATLDGSSYEDEAAEKKAWDEAEKAKQANEAKKAKGPA